LVDPDVFLKQEVESATPAKLRWMLLRKAVGLSEAVQQMQADGKKLEAGQWWIRVRDILSELLDGVTDKANPAAEPISNLYTYLIQIAAQIDQEFDQDAVSAFIEILRIEEETWNLFQLRESRSIDQQPHFSFGLSGRTSTNSDSSILGEESGFSFEA
jgi:flagellin-specific chaperone FliS